MSYDNYNAEQEHAMTERPRMPGLYYEPSGKFSGAAPFYMLIFGTIAALISGAIYAYVSLYNPFVIVTFIATAIYGFVLGIAVFFGADSGKVRAPWLAGLLGLAVGFIGVYGQWVFWLHAYAARYGDPGIWVISPIDVLNSIGAIAKEGVWELEDWTPTGAALYIVWVLEALIITGISAILPLSTVSDSPFCEICQEWATDEFDKELQIGPVKDIDTMINKLETRNFEELEKLGPPKELEHTKVTLLTCPKCKQIGFLDVSSIQISFDDEDGEETDEDPIVTRLILNKESMDKIRDLFANPPVDKDI